MGSAVTARCAAIAKIASSAGRWPRSMRSALDVLALRAVAAEVRAHPRPFFDYGRSFDHAGALTLDDWRASYGGASHLVEPRDDRHDRLRQSSETPASTSTSATSSELRSAHGRAQPSQDLRSPFVVTLAAIPACFTESSPPPQQPQPKPVETRLRPRSSSRIRPHRRPVDPRSRRQKPQTYNFDQRWTVSKTPNGCQAMARVECPKPKHPGDPVPTCNPPPPMKIACPDGWDGATTLTVVQYANQANCVIEPRR